MDMVMNMIIIHMGLCIFLHHLLCRDYTQKLLYIIMTYTTPLTSYISLYLLQCNLCHLSHRKIIHNRLLLLYNLRKSHHSRHLSNQRQL